jgi:hypothetical protein
MTSERSSQGITIRSRPLWQTYGAPWVAIAVTGVYLIPSIWLLRDFLFRIQLDGDRSLAVVQVITGGLLLSCFIRAGRSTIQFCSRFQVQSITIDPMSGRLTLKLFNMLFQRKVLSVNSDEIESIRLLHFPADAYRPEAHHYRIWIQFYGDREPLYLDRVDGSVQDIQVLTHELEQMEGLLFFVDSELDLMALDAGNWGLRWLDFNSERIGFTLDYSVFTLLASLFVWTLGRACFAVLPSMVALGGFIAVPFQIAGFISPIVIVALMQRGGFQETWRFDRSSDQFQRQIDLLWGRRILRYSCGDIRRIDVVQRQAGRCHVAIDAPSLKLWQNYGNLRIIYTGRTSKFSYEFARRLRYCLNLPG